MKEFSFKINGVEYKTAVKEIEGGMTEVTVNGKAYPALWKPPFVVDITDAVKPGEIVELEVKVTNYWPNRLIGDARLADDCEWDAGDKSRGYPLVKRWPGWLKEGSAWYYLDPESGAMATGWTKVNGTWYYLDKTSGSMKTGWLKLDGEWYYLDLSSGAMANAITRS